MARRLTTDEFLRIAVGLLDKREADPPYVHWVIGKDGDDLVGDFCGECVKLEVAQVLAAERLLPLDSIDDLAEIRTIYEYPETEDDGCRHCETCGKLLAYTLTDYGVIEELGHFEQADATWDWNSADDCYHLARIAHGIYRGKAQERALIKVLRKGKNRPPELKAALAESEAI